MDNQHKFIAGYRDLTREEIKLMNAVKAKAEEVGELLKTIPPTASPTDKAWLDAGRLQIQQGFMAVIRSIAKPTTF